MTDSSSASSKRLKQLPCKRILLLVAFVASICSTIWKFEVFVSSARRKQHFPQLLARCPAVARQGLFDSLAAKSPPEPIVYPPVVTGGVPGQRPLSERIFLVTGASDGIGLQTAELLLEQGCTVIMHGRRGNVLQHRMKVLARKYRNATVDGFEADFHKLSEARKLGKEIAKMYPRIDGIFHNAATIDGSFTGVKMLAYGNKQEETVAVNAMAPFIITSLLLPALQNAGHARVLFSLSDNLVDGSYLNDLQCETRWTGMHAYSLSKLCCAVLAKELDARYGEAPHLCFHSMYPGAFNTKLLRQGSAAGKGHRIGRGTRREPYEFGWAPEPKCCRKPFEMLVNDEFQLSSGSMPDFVPEVVSNSEARAKLWEDFVAATSTTWAAPNKYRIEERIPESVSAH